MDSRAADDQSRPRLLMVIPDLGGGGAERTLSNLLATMRPDLFEYHLAIVNRRGPGGTEYAISPHVTTHRLMCRRVETSTIAVRRCIRRVRPHVICSHIAAMNAVTTLAHYLSGHRASLVLVDHHMADRSEVGAGPLHRLLPLLMRWMYPRADRVVGVSGAVLTETLRRTGARPDKGLVIYNGIVPDGTHDLSLRPAGHPWADDPGHELVIAVGRLVGVKDLRLLIEAFARVRAVRAAARLLILGDGPLRDSLQAAIREFGVGDHAQLLGFRSNPLSFMRRAKVLAMTSLTEGLPTVAIEAMACGTPVVATLFDGSEDLLPAWTPPVRSRTARAVAKAILEALDHPPDAERLREYASGFSTRTAAARYEQLFTELVSERSATPPPDVVYRARRAQS